MATPRDIISNALELIGVLAPGETASAAQLTSGLRSFNRMLENWSTENLMHYGETTEDLTLVASQKVYTMGTGGDLNTTKPVEILNITWKDDFVSPALELPVEIVDQRQYKFEETKDITSNIVTKAYINFTDPLVNISVYPVPSAAKKLSITSNKPITTYTSLSTSIALPVGWLEALEYNLALRVRPSYGVPLDAYIDKIARQSKANIKRQNIKPIKVGTEIASIVGSKLSAYDYRTGE